MRIDKFLWCVRLARTRTLAADLCKRERVLVNDKPAKAGTEVKVGDRLALRVPPIWRVHAVKAIPASRVGPPLVRDLLEEVTPWSDLEKLEMARKVMAQSRQPGAGRPTKQDRRAIDRFNQDG